MDTVHTQMQCAASESHKEHNTSWAGCGQGLSPFPLGWKILPELSIKNAGFYALLLQKTLRYLFIARNQDWRGGGGLIGSNSHFQQQLTRSDYGYEL